MFRIQLDDDRLFQLKLIALRKRGDRIVDEIRNVGVKYGSLVIMQTQNNAWMVSLLAVRRKALDNLEIVEAVDESQRVDDLGTERITAVGDLEMSLRFIDAILAQQVHAEF